MERYYGFYHEIRHLGRSDKDLPKLVAVRLALPFSFENVICRFSTTATLDLVVKEGRRENFAHVAVYYHGLRTNIRVY